VLVAGLCFVAVASALVKPSLTTTYSDPTLGGHPDLTVGMTFDYGATATTGSGVNTIPDPATYPQPSSWKESVKAVVVDTPPGLVGNPNAIPYDQRCEPLVFQTGDCPASATIGDFTIKAVLLPRGDASDPPADVPGEDYVVQTIKPWTGVNPPAATAAYTRLSLIKSTPEVPAQIGVMVQPPFGLFTRIHQLLKIYPDTATDLKLRTETVGDIPSQLFDINAPSEMLARLRIDAMQIKFLGKLANGNAFMTNSTSCQKWDTRIWANAHEVNNKLDSDPLGTGTIGFIAGLQQSSITPDCTNQGAIPFPASGTTTISSNKRDVSPDFDFTVFNPGVQANGQVSTSPKSVVTTVPASINVDVNQLNRTCPSADFDADHCPAPTRVGTVAIESPLVAAGLSGDVYLVRRAEAGLPDLGLQIRGAIHFTQRGHNRYVDGNKIQTTFDNIPQVGFSKLNVHLFGGPQGLLRTLGCPKNNKQPAIGDFNYAFTSYTGATTSSTSKLAAANCFGIQKLRSFKCVYRQLRFQPTYTSRARIKRVVLKVDKRKVATAKRVPFQFRVPARKFKKGKHKIELAARYDDGTVSKKASRFKRC
jgi:hypothetical protein